MSNPSSRIAKEVPLVLGHSEVLEVPEPPTIGLEVCIAAIEDTVNGGLGNLRRDELGHGQTVCSSGAYT